jgi:phospholipase/carboxylesterase
MTGTGDRRAKPVSTLSHIHRFVAGSQPSRPALLLMHGTGGDETQLLAFGSRVAPGRALLSVRGRVLENGMARFFRRHAEGVLDEDDVRRRADDLSEFVAAAGKEYGLTRLIAVGRSNGANMAAALLQLHPVTMEGAVLLRAVAPLSVAPASDLSLKRVLILSGERDAVAPIERATTLADQLTSAGAAVQHSVLPCGHEPSPMDVERTTRWLGLEYPR